MTPKRELLARHRAAILDLAARHGATDVRVFGSVARGEETPESDLDLIVRFPQGGTLSGLCGLGEDLETLLGCKVDLVTDHPDMRPHFREELRRDAIAV